MGNGAVEESSFTPRSQRELKNELVSGVAGALICVESEVTRDWTILDLTV